MNSKENLVTRLRKRAEIRRNIPHRKSVQEGKPDRLAELLDEAADEIIRLKTLLNKQYATNEPYYATGQPCDTNMFDEWRNEKK